VLGRDIGQVYSQDELHKLIRIHIENPDAQGESGLNRDDGGDWQKSLKMSSNAFANPRSLSRKPRA
jgi:hypothetical protein